MARKGSVWVDSTDIHFVGEDGIHWIYTGTANGSNPVGVKKGCVWIDTHLWYIDANGAQRYVPDVVMSATTGAVGSAWINNKFIYWIDQTQTIRYGHSDVAGYGDYGDSRAHSDVAHGDQAHKDQAAINVSGYHTDYNAYCDVTGWAGSHGDQTISYTNYPHADTPHSDSAHADVPSYGDYGDSRAHQDSPTQGATLP